MLSGTPMPTRFLADISAVVEYQDIEEGVTMSQQVDVVTGFATKVITEHKGTDVKPTILLKDKDGQSLNLPGRDIPARYVIPWGLSFLWIMGLRFMQVMSLPKFIGKLQKPKTLQGVFPGGGTL